MFDQIKGFLGDRSIIHFSHTDLDGYAPQILSRLSSLKISEYFHLNYDVFDNALMEVLDLYETYPNLNAHALVITDIAPRDEVVIQRIHDLHKKGLFVLLLDHHDTAKGIAERYPEWAFVESSLNGQKTCGTELYYLYLREQVLLPAKWMDSPYLKSFVEHVRSYDTWDWTRTDNQEAKELNALLYLMGKNLFVDKQEEKIRFHGTDPEATTYTFNEMERFIIEIENNRERKYIDSRLQFVELREWQIDKKSYNVAVVFATTDQSSLGNAMSLAHPETDFAAVIDPEKNKVSLRTIHDHVHLGEIAGVLHPKGGGHPKSAGFSIEGSLLEDGFNKLVLKPKTTFATRIKNIMEAVI